MIAIIKAWLAQALGVTDLQREVNSLRVRLIEAQQQADELAAQRGNDRGGKVIDPDELFGMRLSVYEPAQRIDRVKP